MIVRDRQRHFEIPELESELPAPQKLLVLPARHVGEGRHPRIPLGDGVDVILVLLEILVASPRPQVLGIHDVVLPVDPEGDLPTRRHRHRQFNPHHGLHDPVAQLSAILVVHANNLIAALEFLPRQFPAQGPESHFIEIGRLHRLVTHRLLPEAVLIELHPEVAQGKRRVVGVGDGLRAGQPLLPVVERHRDLVIGPLLPVLRSRSSVGSPYFVRIG